MQDEQPQRGESRVRQEGWAAMLSPVVKSAAEEILKQQHRPWWSEEQGATAEAFNGGRTLHVYWGADAQQRASDAHAQACDNAPRIPLGGTYTYDTSKAGIVWWFVV